ncbi:Diacylglycerol kinase catalytic domain family protein [Candida parapsilosis]|uniref:Diacylglycerol kinase catalytic domain family protein n=1 Tax=Candida parapsilosis TaxID=5480 RepID=A0A8X7NHE6_CANPA|nr:Diacylglycerol kinase catalytic domain family protein [Candida parapsilosis]KAF6047293.1 Diacylglycerol kinase catalytic domain family protein [Candida parapsilosis]KAF6050736.1 Diacylglycerol kinase catalytic domain family protein [Candida parapsilosis]KAF6061855.1 Diacylglycerol kinase catalytic domain family protein [Candida parapsilosis]KAI5905828.1 hypothetical protein K4G60_g5099 [Candida parapsilosis]
MSHKIYFEPNRLVIELIQDDASYTYKETQVDKSDATTTVVKSLPKSLIEKGVYIIDSINSGIGRSDERNLYTRIIKPLFESLCIKHRHFKTENARSISEFASNFQDVDATVVFLSGDTSITEFINALNPSGSGSISIIPIPVGTGNSFALSLGLTDPISSIVRLLQTETVSPLYLYTADVPSGTRYLVQDEFQEEVVSPTHFIVVFSWAFHASLVADSDTPELRKYGIERFKIAAQNNLSREQKYEADLLINDEVIGGPFAYWVLTPSKKFEPTFDISPEGDIFDDNLYLIAFRTKPNDNSYIMDIMKQVYDGGNHINNPDVIYREINPKDRVQLKLKNSEDLLKRRFCVDGSIIALPDAEKNSITIQVKDNTLGKWKLFILH